VVSVRITSTANPRVKAFAKLKTARERARSELFLIEGVREVERAIAADVEIVTLLVCPELLGEAVPVIPTTVERLELAEAAMGRVAIRQNPPGLIAVARQFDTRLSSLELSETPLVLIAEDVEKPGNLGAMLRTADAAGVDAVVVAGAGTDVFNPNVVRASQGAVFSVAVARGSTAEVIEWALGQSLAVVGGYPDDADDLWDVSMTGRVAILVGAEDVGITDAWAGIAKPVRIPMLGTADSLNASVSVGVLLYEAVRQRHPYTPGV
jgi:TrmH family RNA methyltransferase